jgi:DnaJ-domain-containing protein 1
MEKISIIKTDKTVSHTLADLRQLFRRYELEEWEPIPAEKGPGYSVRYFRNKTWTEIGSFYQPTKAMNLRVCYQVIDNMFRWEARGVTGLVRGTAFMGGELVATARPEGESFDEACAILGVDPEASWEEIQRVYQVKVQYVHPDKKGDPDRFKRLTKAYDLIGKVKKGK